MDIPTVSSELTELMKYSSSKTNGLFNEYTIRSGKEISALLISEEVWLQVWENQVYVN